MRDPKRIPRILKLLEEYWTRHPDLRLGQLMYNLTPTEEGVDDKVDIFNVEDDEWESTILGSLTDLGNHGA